MFDNSWAALLTPGKAEFYFDAVPRPAFEPATAGFSVANAWWLAELSRLIYREEEDESPARQGEPRRDQLLAAVGLQEERFFHRGNVQCALIGPRTAVAAPFAVLSFRGSSELRDWVTNLRAVTAEWPLGGHVHRGFRRAIRKVWSEVGDHLVGCRRPLFYTGHSLGGALATLAASMLLPRAVYTFGSPRVGDADFGATLGGTAIHRVVNHRDLVTAMPPSGEPLGFRHVGQLHYITGEGQILSDPGDAVLSGLRRMDKDGPIAADDRRWFDPAAFLADHAPVNYVAHLRGLL